MKALLTCSLLLIAACSSRTPLMNNDVTSPSAAPVPTATPAASPSVPLNFRAHLKGQDVFPSLAIPTLAQGQVIFQLNPEGTALSFRLIVSNIENISGAHVHIGPAGGTGPQGARLIPNQPGSGVRSDGVLAEGTLTASNLIGVLAGQPLTALIDAMKAGNVYIDIPTNDNVAPGNTGPGDYVTGEVRGQVF
jgi:hypothetical protein